MTTSTFRLKRWILPAGVAALCGITAFAGTQITTEASDKPADYRLYPGEARQLPLHLDPRTNAPLINKKSPIRFAAKAASMLPGAKKSKQAAADDDTPVLQGLLIKNADWSVTMGDEGAAPGVYTLPLNTSSPSAFPLVKDLSNLPWTLFGSFGAVYSPTGFYYNLADYQNGRILGTYHYIFDPETWEISKSWHSDDFSVWVNSGAYDPTSGLIYANITMANDHYNAFATYDIENAEAKIISRLDYNDPMRYGTYRLACASNGTLYGISTPRPDDDNPDWEMWLVKVDKATGNVEKIGKLPFDYNKTGAEYSFTIDPTDTYAYLVFDVYAGYGNGGLYKVSLRDAETTLVYETPNNEGFQHIWFPFTVSGDVPEAVSGLSIDFVNDSLSGNVVFRTPSKAVNGAALSGELTYDVVFNGEKVATGKTSADQLCEVPVTVSAANYYNIGVRVKNAAGYSAIASTAAHIGRDVPSVLKNVKAVYDKTTKTFTVTWDTPEPLYGGYFEPEKLTYTISDYNGKYVYGVKGNSYTATIDEPENAFLNWYYRVQPVYDGQTFQAVSSNRVPVGNMILPYECYFEGPDCGGYTFINANNDWREWEIRTLWKDMVLQGNETYGSDDWAILPPVKMEAGKAYRINLDLRPHMPSMPETFTINVGNDTTVNALSQNVILPETTIYNEYKGDWVHAYFAPKEDGYYHYAIHSVTGPQNGTLYCYGATIEEPISATLPAEMTDFTVNRSDDGSLKAILRFTASSRNLAGDAISSLTKIQIHRDGELLDEISATPGQAITWEDTTVPENGTYTYTVTPWTEEGAGVGCVRSAFIGVRVPAEMKWIKVTRGVDWGHYIIEWDSDAVDVAGDPFDEELLSYNLYMSDPRTGEQVTIGKNLKDKKKVYRVCQPDDEQCLVFFGVEPVNNAGAGYGKMSEAIFAGKPDVVPYRESFSGKSAHHVYYIDYHPYYYAIWLFANDADFPDVRSVDSDNGFIAFGSMDAGNQASYISGTIDLAGVANPVFSYFYYTWKYSNTVELEICDAATGEWKSMDFFACNEKYLTNGGEDEWVRRAIDLSEFAGKTIRYRLVGRCVDALYSLIDNIIIGEQHETDLDISGLKAVAKVKAGQQFDVTATVANFGSKFVTSYKVDLYDNDELVASVSKRGMAVGASEKISFPRVITMAETPDHRYRMEVETEGDEDLTNNVSSEITVSCSQTIFPEPTELTAEESAPGKVSLSWTEADLSGSRRRTVTDDVEDYTDFSTGLKSTEIINDYIGEWTMVDGDDYGTYTFNNASSYPNRQNKMAFLVFNCIGAGVDPETSTIWAPHSGDKMFASFLPLRKQSASSFDDPEGVVEKDDWMISPRLNGDAQTISFWARTMSPSYSKERFMVYYSTGDSADTDSMIQLGEELAADYDWEQYEFDLPEGARYFAIRNVGGDGFVFLVDDLVYAPASASGEGLVFKGYNVYRDCNLVTPQPVMESSFLDRGVETGDHSYQVTAVYDRGESVPAQTTLFVATVGSVTAGELSAFGAKGVITILNGTGMQAEILTVDGRRQGRVDLNAPEETIECEPGIYIVNIGNRSFKTIVR